ncbi:caprin homolog isoform X1 [Onthophagus taurus]|uniref:caprin homolog isoform X1 n=1 Tax=Onthophagus taurus TaxID=166361 RepID=UPI0039BE610A
MPSAANVKIDKQQIAGEGSTNATVVVGDPSVTGPNSTNPLRQAIITIEHKIRNLEKRKAKLISYKQLQSSGKELNQDQKTAIAKFDEVVQTLDFARDLCKQFIGLALVSEKEAKKQARKDALAKSQSELAKVREVLLVQDALTQMGQENIRDDFLHGRNGAAQLSETDLKLLDDLYTNVTPKHEPGDSQIFCTQIQGAAEHLLAVVDGKPKEIFGSTYGHIKDIIGKIHESGYFDQSQQEQFVEVVDVETEEGVVEATPSLEIINHEMIESIDSITIEARPPPPPPVVQPLTPVQPPQPVEPPPMVPVIPADQQPIYYAAAPQHQPPQQPQQQPQQPPPRPLSDVLGNGSFTFLQDSELDTPPEQIPSQTFTNQSYVQGPPPPIPMPPHFQPYPQPIPPQQQQAQQQQQQPPPPQQLSPSVPQQTNNLDEANHHDHQMNDVQKQRGGRPRAVGGNQQQPFYANNNGYSNRQRQNRNGPGPRSSNNNNRHNQ